MPAQVYWFAVAGFALLMTLSWLFINRRITMTGVMAGILWSYAALTGDAVYRITETGEQVSMPVGNIQYLTLVLALYSFLAVILYRFGHYPPTDDDPTQGESTA
jgi:hypothetical protein